MSATNKQDMSDLYQNGTLLTTRLSPRASQRYEQALWYTWGRQDAGDNRTRGKVAGHYLGDDFAFAEYAALDAERYERGTKTMLRSITGQHNMFMSGIAIARLLSGGWS